MATTNYNKANILQTLSPHTANALANLVMAMAAVHNNAGRKTWFGRDKGVESYRAFQEKLKATIVAMLLDGLISEATSDEDIAQRLELKLSDFADAFPNWKDAYAFAALFLSEEQRPSCLALIQRLR